ncbi:MAG: serine/threonine-protein kinase [Pirellulaceae bacterium]
MTSKHTPFSLFEAAIESDFSSLEQLEQFLVAQAEGDSDLVDKVKRLLSTQSDAESFFNRATDFVGGLLEDEFQLVSDDPAIVIDGLLRQLRLDDTHTLPAKLGRFTLESYLGTGGMGIVVKAIETSLNRPVAMKFLRSEFANSAGGRQRFIREAQIAASLTHPNIAATFSIEDDFALPCIVMELVQGECLLQLVRKHGPLSLEDALRYAIQISDALAEAHSKGIIHRDIKPANVLIEPSILKCKLTDFGLAKAVEDTGLTKSGIVAGTPQYMSPEQAKGLVLDERSDLFSLGSVLYFMVSGEPPFNSESMFGTLHQVSEASPKLLSERNADIPAWFSNLVGKIMAKEPGDRFQTAGELSDVLTRCLKSHSANTQIDSKQFVILRKRAMNDRRNSVRTWAVFGFTTLVLLAVISTLYFGNWLGTRTPAEDLSENTAPQQIHRRLPIEIQAPETEKYLFSNWDDYQHLIVDKSNIQDVTEMNGTRYWAPTEIGKWGEITLKLEFSKPMETCTIRPVLHCFFVFDIDAKATVEISTDGENWTEVERLSIEDLGVSEEAIGRLRDQDETKLGLNVLDREVDISKAVKGKSTVFMKIRLFGIKSITDEDAKIELGPTAAQFMRSSEDNPQAWGFMSKASFLEN